MIEKIKRVVDKIYEFDFSKTELIDGNEIVTKDGVSEFVMALRKRDLDKGIIVTPAGYTNGLVYKSSNGGELYNNPSWVPDIVHFTLNIYGLKKGSFYKITVISRDTGKSTIITNDRTLKVTNEDKELLLDYDLCGINKNKECFGIFRTLDNETNLFFSLGKIYIKDIIIEEVEMLIDIVEDEEIPDIKIEDGKLKLVAYGIFSTQPVTDAIYKGRYLQMTKYTGKGINLYFDKTQNQYLLERDNIEDIIGETFTNINYLVDFNLNKVVNKGLFSQYNICEVNTDISPNTLKQGFIRFEFADAHDQPVKYTNKDGRIAILIYKLL